MGVESFMNEVFPDFDTLTGASDTVEAPAAAAAAAAPAAATRLQMPAQMPVSPPLSPPDLLPSSTLAGAACSARSRFLVDLSQPLPPHLVP
eukprot:910222-Prymnesium_polylepis.1